MKNKLSLIRAGQAVWARLALVLLALGLMAQSARATDPDPATIVTSATTLFGTVAALVITVVTFFIGVRFVKYIRK